MPYLLDSVLCKGQGGAGDIERKVQRHPGDSGAQVDGPVH